MQTATYVIAEITVLLMPNILLVMYLHVHLGCAMDVGKTDTGVIGKTAMSMMLRFEAVGIDLSREVMTKAQINKVMSVVKKPRT